MFIGTAVFLLGDAKLEADKSSTSYYYFLRIKNLGNKEKIETK